MVRKIIESCPSCGGPVEISEVRCTRCETKVQARYRPCDFCALSQEQSTFLHIFLTSRGNLSDVEKRLGVSYPTVRAKQDEVIARQESTDQERRQQQQQQQPAPTPAPAPRESNGGASDRRAILEAVSRGELDPTVGLERIRALNQG